MKSKKEQLLEYFVEITQKEQINEKRYFTTDELAKALHLQRSNASKYLNELVAENKVIKRKGKPVYYQLNLFSDSNDHEDSFFKNYVGYHDSCKNAVQLAKAAILYPSHSLSTILVGPSGSGKSYFAYCMARFATERDILKQDAPILKFNCRYYENDDQAAMENLFGEEGMIAKAKNGLLYIDRIELLPARTSDTFFKCLEMHTNGIDDLILICSCDNNIGNNLLSAYTAKFPLKIEIPDLISRSLKERFELIKYFFNHEAALMKKDIKINAELLRCVLLYHPQNNVKQLKESIKIGCANAYVRQVDRNLNELTIYANDFPADVKKGFLYYKEYREQVEAIISQNYLYTFTNNTVNRTERLIYSTLKTEETIYDIIDKKAAGLKKDKMTDEEISTIIYSDLHRDYQLINKKIAQNDVNKETISKIVDLRIISFVEQFLNEASSRLGIVYSETVFYSLCLHCNAWLEHTGSRKNLPEEQADEIRKKYPVETELGHNFIIQFNHDFDMQLSKDEGILIALILGAYYEEEEKSPVILVAMHGNSTASSIAEVVNKIMNAGNIYAFDLALDKPVKTVYEELCKLMTDIDRGQGILVLYDMGSIKSLIEMVVQEIGIQVRMIEIPATLIALDASRKAVSSHSLNELYQNVSQSIQQYSAASEKYQPANNRKVIVTLCMSGKGGALQMKKYIQKNCNLEDIDVIALAVSDRRLLKRKINNIIQEQEIICLVGTYDPKLYGLPFISISKLFDTPADKLDMLLTSDHFSNSQKTDFETIYNYLSENMPGFNIRLLRRTVPRAINRIKKLVNGLSPDQEIGLLLHVACCIYRMQKENYTSENIHRDAILNKNKRLYYSLKDVLLPLEEEFEIRFNDDEIANIISIIRLI